MYKKFTIAVVRRSSKCIEYVQKYTQINVRGKGSAKNLRCTTPCLTQLFTKEVVSLVKLLLTRLLLFGYMLNGGIRIAAMTPVTGDVYRRGMFPVSLHRLTIYVRLKDVS